MASGRTEAHLLLRALPTPAVLVGAEGRIVEVSERGERALGRSRSELVGTALGSHLGSLGHERLQDALDHLAPDAEVMLRVPDVADGGVSELELRLASTPLGAIVVLERRRPTAQALLAGLLDEVASAEVGTDVLARALGRIASSNHWELAALWAVDSAAELLRPVATWARDPSAGDAHRQRTLLVSLAPGEGVPGRAWAERATLTDADVTDDLRVGEDSARFATTLHHPIVAGGRVVGVIELLAGTD
jgi:phosphoserine phosphatase RsbU/P